MKNKKNEEEKKEETPEEKKEKEEKSWKKHMQEFGVTCRKCGLVFSGFENSNTIKDLCSECLREKYLNTEVTKEAILVKNNFRDMENHFLFDFKINDSTYRRYTLYVHFVGSVDYGFPDSIYTPFIVLEHDSGTPYISQPWKKEIIYIGKNTVVGGCGFGRMSGWRQIIENSYRIIFEREGIINRVEFTNKDKESYYQNLEAIIGNKKLMERLSKIGEIKEEVEANTKEKFNKQEVLDILEKVRW